MEKVVILALLCLYFLLMPVDLHTWLELVNACYCAPHLYFIYLFSSSVHCEV